MADLMLRQDSMALCFSPYEGDSSYLSEDLLLEDGFLTARECRRCENTADLRRLLLLAARRGFLLSAELCSEQEQRTVKFYSDLRIWTDLVDENTHLRAPPRRA